LIIGGKIGDIPHFIYRCSKAIINADLNGAIGIIKKVVPEALDLLIEQL
jgi:transposase